MNAEDLNVLTLCPSPSAADLHETGLAIVSVQPISAILDEIGARRLRRHNLVRVGSVEALRTGPIREVKFTELDREHTLSPGWGDSLPGSSGRQTYGVPGSNPGVPTNQNQARTNPPKPDPCDFLAIREVPSTSTFRHVRKCEELRGSAFGHILGHVAGAG